MGGAVGGGRIVMSVDMPDQIQLKDQCDKHLPFDLILLLRIVMQSCLKRRT